MIRIIKGWMCFITYCVLQQRGLIITTFVLLYTYKTY
uniref:Uncharacterized protein n=1 Tax=Myoviridae sp. ct9Ns12 TaxID=2826626 RepID=A0A8S5MH58_9CAUD|nr:MAG TPA: hypothetical protein [Myoviridae sp. ct9Ns12]